MRATLRWVAVLASVAVAAVVLVACGSGDGTSSGGTGSGSSGSGALSVVASTNVWGDVVKQVGGDRVDVLSVISDPGADPHSFEANARTQLAVSKAALLIENGGGYDDFMQTMVAAAGTSAPVVNAVEVSGKQAAAGQELNEHVWFDLPTVQKVADVLAVQLGALDPAGKAEFTANAKAFGDKLQALSKEVVAVKAAHSGTGVAVTEPVPLYLLEDAGLDNLTPERFSDAVEQDTDVPPTVLQDMLALFSDRKVKALFYNEQAGGPQADAVLDAAKNNDIAVVPVSETLPEGQDYPAWMQANISAMARAVGG